MTYFDEIVEEVAAWRKKFSGMRPKQIAEKLNLHPTGMPMGNHKGCLKGILFRSSREYTLIYNTDLNSRTQDSIIMHEITIFPFRSSRSTGGRQGRSGKSFYFFINRRTNILHTFIHMEGLPK